MMRRACSVDANQREVVEALLRLGWDVIDTHQCAQYVPGFPDLVAARAGVTLFVEVKDGKAKLSDDEELFWQRHQAYLPLCIVRTVEDCIAISGGKML